MSILRGCVKNLRICRLLIILLLFQGSMQKEIRHGHVKKPRYLRNVPISLQRSFKGVKWWTEQPHEGMVFMKAKKKDLIAHFKEQLLKVWNVSGDQSTLINIYKFFTFCYKMVLQREVNLT